MIWGPLIAFMLSQQPAETRCTLRLSAKGVFVDGDAMTREQAIAACKQTNGAIVIVADDAPPQAWPELQGRLRKAAIKIYMRGTIDDRPCLDNPLAKGCETHQLRPCLENPLGQGCP